MSLWIEAFSGLGLFLFGMLYLEAEIKASAGVAFKRWVKQTTNTHFKSFLTGLFATTLFQSSSVVTLMALSLIGAQLMSFESAIAVIFGSNIGTTVTTWIVGLVGFKMDIRLISYAFIGIGGLGSVLTGKESRWKNYFGVMVGFGLIFLGLEGMKESFSVFSKTFDISAYHFSNLYWYAFIGFGITALIQSSSAAIAIIQSALYASMIGFDAAAAFVIGANIGTTVTASLGAIGGIPDKKRTALAHLIFNLSTGLVALAALKPLVAFVVMIMPNADAVIQIALFHTVFNMVGVILWFPFIHLLAEWLHRFFKREPVYATLYLHNVSVEIPDVALEALNKEVANLSGEVERFALLAIDIPPPKALKEGVPTDKLLDTFDGNLDLAYDKLYDHIRLLEGDIYRYVTQTTLNNRNSGYLERLNNIVHQTSYLATAAKSIKDMLYDLDRLYNAESSEEQTFLHNIRYQILKSVQAFEKAREGDSDALEEMENIYKRIAESYRDNMGMIRSISKNHSIPSEMTTIAVNDMHLSKSFSKSLRNALRMSLRMKELETNGMNVSVKPEEE
ncbi:MAG: Na/Pi symporter [Campylobacterota bacterium]|nr:Na/Pi symporter [Campylobacterota bacterium]